MAATMKGRLESRPRHLNTALRTKTPMPMSKSSTRMRNRAMIMTKPPYWRVAETVGAISAGTKKPPVNTGG
jgi:hypothetical protein